MDSHPYSGDRTARNPQYISPQKSFGSRFSRLFAAILIFYLFIRLSIEMIRRFRLSRASRTMFPVEVELEVGQTAPPLATTAPALETEQEMILETAPQTATDGEISFSVGPEETFPEAPVSFDLFGVEVAPSAIPDLYYTVPSEMVVASFEPQYHFNWQNPALQEDIYPFRIQKLVDFLAFYTEIDLCKEYRAKGTADPTIQAKIQQSEAELRQARQEVIRKLQAAIESRKQTDPYFGKITGLNEKNLRFKQKYYLDREIQRFQDKLDGLEDQAATLLKRVDWYPPGDLRREVWRSRAGALEPQINQVRTELAGVKAFRELFDQEAQLPNIETQKVTIEDVIRWELREKREQWKNKTQDQLLEEIIRDWFDQDPDRFPEWLIYMVTHFSGMRYMSSHGSWAEPRYLLELLNREDLENEINHYDPNQLSMVCSQTVQELQKRVNPKSNDPSQKFIGDLVKRLQTPAVQKRALLEFQTARLVEEIQNLPDDNACLNRLVQYKEEKDASGDPLPPWVWCEIVKYTPLRLLTDDPNWEAFSPERWKWTNQYWREILNTWQQKDITSWRKKHRESLELVVTRAVCNEVAEHIQHLRGLAAPAGLTAKPLWYMRQAAKDSQRAYFKQAPDEEDFKTGATILWLEWVDKQPNAWQVARLIPEFTFYPGQASGLKSVQKGEVRKQEIDKDWDPDGGWNYQQTGNTFIRTRRKPSAQELKKQGKRENEIKKSMAARTVSGEFDKQYLRWRHEATVIDVVDMVDGRYVMTFETGQIGVILRRLSDLRGNPMVFAGYVPDAPSLPPELDHKLVEMLRWDRVLPGAGLPARVRPRR